jgi:hypothetical protein
MKTHYPQNLERKTTAAIVGVIAIGLVVAWQDAAATDAAADAAFRAGYFPAQFQLKAAADESAEPIPTF